METFDIVIKIVFHPYLCGMTSNHNNEQSVLFSSKIERIALAPSTYNFTSWSNHDPGNQTSSIPLKFREC